MKTLNYGKKNDCSLFANEIDGKLYLGKENDEDMGEADYKINFDSGVYPGITDVEQYILDQINLNGIKRSTRQFR